MLNTWEEYTFLVLVLSAFALAIASGDNRVRIGAVTLLGAWVLSEILLHFVLFIPYVVSFIGVNIAVFYVFLQLHFWADGEESGPVWPVFIMGLEFLIFLSHLAFFFGGWMYYMASLNILFGLELLFMIGIGLMKTVERFRPASN